MATVGLPFTNVEPLTGIVNITVPSRSGDVISIGGVAEPGETINFIPDATGTPSDITLENTTFGLDTALSTSNPITLNFQGVDITATVPPSLLSFIQVPDSGEGTGLPSGTSPGDGSIIMQAASPFWEPDQLGGIANYWTFDSSRYTASPFGFVSNNDATDSLSSTSAPAFDATASTLEFIDSASNFVTLPDPINTASCGFMLVFKEIRSDRTPFNQGWITIASGSQGSIF